MEMEDSVQNVVNADKDRALASLIHNRGFRIHVR